MLGLRLIENLILPYVKNPFDLLSMAHTCSGIRKYVRNMRYWKCSRNPVCEDKCGFDEFVWALRFLSGLDSRSDTYCISYLIRFVVYPYLDTGFEYGGDNPHRIEDMVFPCLTWFPPITAFNYIMFSDWDYHNVGEEKYGIRTVSTNLIMKRICLYYCGELEYDYNNTVQCDWSRLNGCDFYTMMPDRICRKR
jgi:hypothetical protein